MPCKLTNPLNVYSITEQTINRNHVFVVMPQHINNQQNQHKPHKLPKSKKKNRTGKDTDRVEIPCGKNTYDLATSQISADIWKFAYPNEGSGWESLRP